MATDTDRQIDLAMAKLQEQHPRHILDESGKLTLCPVGWRRGSNYFRGDPKDSSTVVPRIIWGRGSIDHIDSGTLFRVPVYVWGNNLRDTAELTAALCKCFAESQVTPPSAFELSKFTVLFTKPVERRAIVYSIDHQLPFPASRLDITKEGSITSEGQRIAGYVLIDPQHAPVTQITKIDLAIIAHSGEEVVPVVIVVETSTVTIDFQDPAGKVVRIDFEGTKKLSQAVQIG